MFDLDQAIGNWRRQMSLGAITSAEILDELESHLRDDIEQQVNSGREPKAAFDSAVGRLGSQAALEEEFAKSGGIREQRRRRFLRATCFISAVLVCCINAWTLVEFELSLPERLLGFCSVVGTAVYLASLPFLARIYSLKNCVQVLVAVKILGLLMPLGPILATLSACHILPLEIGVLPGLIVALLYVAIVITLFAFGLYESRTGLGAPGSPVSLSPSAIQPGSWDMLALGLPGPIERQLAPAAQQSIQIAREEASRLGHNYIGTEHVLLGLLKQADSVIARVLQACETDPESVRLELKRLVVAQASQAPSTALPLTPRARKALELAAKEAKKSNQPFVSLEHIFLGLLAEGKGVAALALKNLGIRTARIGRAVAARSKQE